MIELIRNYGQASSAAAPTTSLPKRATPSCSKTAASCSPPDYVVNGGGVLGGAARVGLIAGADEAKLRGIGETASGSFVPPRSEESRRKKPRARSPKRSCSKRHEQPLLTQLPSRGVLSSRAGLLADRLVLQMSQPELVAHKDHSLLNTMPSSRSLSYSAMKAPELTSPRNISRASSSVEGASVSSTLIVFGLYQCI